MPATKPTSSGAVALQTGHANYANLVRCFSFLDGSGTAITDHKAVGNLTLTIDGAGGGWQTSTTPYGVAMAHNNGTGGSTHFTGSHSFDLSLGATVFCRVKIDSLDPTNGNACSIFSGSGWNSAEPTPEGVSMMIKQDNNLYGTTYVNGGWRKTGYVPITLGQWATLCIRYDYAGASAAGEVKVFKNGIDASGAQTTSGDRPGQFNDPTYASIASGKMNDASTEAGWAGEFDVLYVFNAALSDADILALHNDPYAVIAEAAAPPVEYDQTAVGATTNYVGGAPVMVVDGAGAGQSSGKPTSLGGIDLQTAHALYPTMTHVWTFLDGSGTTATESRDFDSLGDDNLTLTLNGTSAWETGAQPYGYNFVVNTGGVNDSFGNSSVGYPAGSSLVYALKGQVDSIDPDGSWGVLLSNGTYNNSGIRIAVDRLTNKVTIGVGYTHGQRYIYDIPYTLGTELRVIMSYDFGSGVLTGWINGTKYLSPANNGNANITHGDGAVGVAIGDKPFAFGTPGQSGLYVGKNGEVGTSNGFTGFIDILYRFNAALTDQQAAALDDDFYSLITANSGSSPAQTYDQTSSGYTGQFVGGGMLYSGHGVLANDTSDLGPLTIYDYTQPSNGVLTLNPDGTGEWDSQGYMGSDSFTYRATDGTDISAWTTVTLTAEAAQDLSPSGFTSSFVGGAPVMDTNVGPQTYNQLANGFTSSFVAGSPGLVTESTTTFQATASGAIATFVAGAPRLNTSALFYGFNEGNPYDVRVITYASSGTLVLGSGGESTTFVKQPNDVVLVDILCIDALGSGEQIQLVFSLDVVSATDGNLTSLQMDTDPTTNGTPAVNAAGDTIQTLLSGGTDGVTYKVRVLAGTNYAPTKEFDFYVTVNDV